MLNKKRKVRFYTSKKINAVVCATYVVLMMLPELFMLNTHTWWDAPVATLFNTAYYGVFFWILCAITSLTKRKTEIIIHATLQTVVAAYSISNLFMLIKFNRHWDAYSWQFLCETNTRESSEFFSSYILTLPTLGILSVYTLLFVAEISLSQRVKRWRIFPSHRLSATAFAVLCVVMMGQIVFYGPNVETNYNRVAKFKSPIKRNAMWNIWQSALTSIEFRNEFTRCANSLQRYNEKVTCNEQESDFVLIVGESFNRHMSNLYDGTYNTNPRLKARVNQGNLFIFNDVIASDNGTTQNFKQFLSPVAVGDSCSWCDAPLFPFILRRCGYNVVFYSNQFAGMEMDKEFNASMGFFNAPGIGPYIFNHHNTHTFNYDMQLLNDYCKKRNEIEATKQNFIIFHLYGQHATYSERYPAEFAKFKACNIKSQLPLSKEQRSVVANYLNATCYNDFVVDSIISMFSNRDAIVMYFSDHGEEVYNYRLQQGRTDLKNDDLRAMHHQLDIPFFIYVSPRYAAKHPQVVKSISKSVNRPFMTDNLPQVIFNLLGVHTRYYNPSRSVINERYHPKNKRKLQVGKVYH